MTALYYPAFINLRGKKCVVVGGGKVAERKVIALLKAGAEVEVISPCLTTLLRKYCVAGRIRHKERQYRKGDLGEAFLVIAATSDEGINKRVSRQAPCLVNVVDVPELANFIVPSILRRGELTIAVSTGGASPAFARAVRRELETLYGEDFTRFVALLRRFRQKTFRETADRRLRSRILLECGSEELLTILRKEGYEAARKALHTRSCALAAAYPAERGGQD